MGDVAVHNNTMAHMANNAPPTIQIIVVDEKGTKANCKLYRTERLSEILRKYNSRLHTSYDAIMINNIPVQLTQTPALLGLEDGQVLKFCKTNSSASSSASSSPASFASSTSSTSTVPSNLSSQPRVLSTLANGTGISSSLLGSFVEDEIERERDRVPKLEQRVAMLEMELETTTQRNELLQTQILNLENKLTEEQEKTQCRICFDRYRDTVIFPCLHFSYCFKCLEDLTQRNTRECPTCRAHISGSLRMQIG